MIGIKPFDADLAVERTVSSRRAMIEVHRAAARKDYLFIYSATKCPSPIVIIERLCNNRSSGSIAEGNK